jgi:hypothetical protein
MVRGMTKAWAAVVLAGVLAAGCATEGFSEDDLGTETGELCLSCGANGLPLRPSDYMPSRLAPYSLKAAGAWGVNGPAALCGNALVNNGCALSAGWSNWINNDGINVQIFTYLVKVAAPANVHVGGYYGEFGLAPEALTAEFGYKQQEVVSAGLIAVLNATHGIQICMRGKDNPNDCPAADGWRYEESVTYGNIFQSGAAKVRRYMAGGFKFGVGVHWCPDRLLRYCSNDGSVDCQSHIENRFGSDDQVCSFADSGESRYPWACNGDGMTWQHPVAVFLLASPDSDPSQYAPTGFTRPNCVDNCREI